MDEKEREIWPAQEYKKSGTNIVFYLLFSRCTYMDRRWQRPERGICYFC